MSASVIILNHNGSRFLGKLFETLLSQTFEDFEMILVDNASTDDSLKVLRRILDGLPRVRPRIKIIESTVNLRYCRGNNAGLKVAKGEYVIFLNNDTYVSKTWLDELIMVMSSRPTIGCCQSRLINMSDGEIQADGWLQDKYGYAERLIIQKQTREFSTLPSFASGASMIVRKTALRLAGGFDPELFYGDYDLCWRLRIAGYGVGVAPLSVCYHLWGGATGALYPVGVRLFHRDKEGIRVLIKCYSGKNIVRRLPISIAIMVFEAAYWTLKFKTLRHFVGLTKALIWDLGKLKNTLIARSRLQMLRRVTDREIDKRLVNFPLLLTIWTRRRLSGQRTG